MDSQTINPIKELLANIENFDIGNVIAEEHPGGDLRTLQIGHIIAAELVDLTKRMTQQFKAELESPNARLLPIGFYWETSRQSNAHRKILDVMTNFWNSMESKNWDTAGQYLDLLIGYQMTCGFWERSSKNRYTENRNRQQSLFNDLDLQLGQMKAATKRADGRASALEVITQQREAETRQMEQLLAESSRQRQQITDLLNHSTSADGTIQQILASQQTNLSETKTLLTQSEERGQKLEGLLRDAAEKLQRSSATLAFLEEKEKWVKDLAGIAAETGLGRKFEARKRELLISARFWLGVVILATGGSAYWLFKTHDWLWNGGKVIDASNIWMVLGVNLGLLVPVIVGLGFAIRQYGKERHYQEEYAFCASVAMTTSAFADRLSDDPVERDKLVKETIEKLFALPLMLREQPRQSIFGPGKMLKDSVQAVTDLVKEIKKN